ncbi:MAG TPA: M56 family metallopeptidase [Candidatus Binataceae bacterium]|nr:M56 family metallopeptidase [Candidatus Binataceae bacterium]
MRAGWSLFRDDGDPGTATVGLLKPWIVFSPHLAKALDDRAIEAALEHERAHARHRDPLRIWLAQLATDLQWPWPQAQERFRAWIVALELARDEEARAAGADGSDLAAAILAAARLRQHAIVSPVAALIGEQSVLKQRIACLLNPLADQAEEIRARWPQPWILAPVLLMAVVLGSAFGEIVVRTLLRIAA